MSCLWKLDPTELIVFDTINQPKKNAVAFFFKDDPLLRAVSEKRIAGGGELWYERNHSIP